MPFEVTPPAKTASVTWHCDRCGKEAVVQWDEHGVIPPIPPDWRMILNPIFDISEGQLEEATRSAAGMSDAVKVFDKRACMSTWLGNLVARVYDEDVTTASHVRAEIQRKADVAAELTRLESAFDEAGGRGVEMAERIDELRGPDEADDAVPVTMKAKKRKE